MKDVDLPNNPEALPPVAGSEIINCGRCAHLHNRGRGSHPGQGRCACNARMIQTGQVRPVVMLDSTCEHAKLSAAFDPNFSRRFHEWKPWDMPPIP